MKIKKNNRLLRRKVRVQTGATWPIYLLLALVFFSLGAGLAYKFFEGGRATEFFLKIRHLNEAKKIAEQELQKTRLELEFSKISLEKISDNNKVLKDKNNILQEDVLFYEKIVGKRK
tara:strand:+ start:70 stop:420 length:351 start_codon:yes stop_codon:yes gene_type:complete